MTTQTSRSKPLYLPEAQETVIRRKTNYPPTDCADTPTIAFWPLLPLPFHRTDPTEQKSVPDALITYSEQFNKLNETSGAYKLLTF